MQANDRIIIRYPPGSQPRLKRSCFRKNSVCNLRINILCKFQKIYNVINDRIKDRITSFNTNDIPLILEDRYRLNYIWGLILFINENGNIEAAENALIKMEDFVIKSMKESIVETDCLIRFHMFIRSYQDNIFYHNDVYLE